MAEPMQADIAAGTRIEGCGMVGTGPPGLARAVVRRDKEPIHYRVWGSGDFRKRLSNVPRRHMA